MPWQNYGDYYCFKEEDIKVHAPPTSGVYGLYNFRHHITIGASANIRDALLRHLRDSTFRFHRFEPTGFTFEVCPKESRDGRMQQLILEYDPIAQSGGRVGLGSLCRSWLTPSARAFDSQVNLASQEYHQKQVPTETKTAPMKPAIGTRFSRDRFVLAGAICSVLLLVVTLFAMLPYLKSSPPTALWQILSAIHWTLSAEEQARMRPLESIRETEIAAERSAADTERSDLENDRNTQPKTEKGIHPFAAEKSPPGAMTPPENTVSDTRAAPLVIEEREKKSQIPSLEKTGKHWTVQVMASPDRSVATLWLEKLNAKGYDAFVVEAEINGKIWYRVRLGTFESRRDAETLGALLRHKEGFQDAFVINSTKSEIVARERS